MRTLVVAEFVSLDGVMQVPGSAEEDTEGGLKRIKSLSLRRDVAALSARQEIIW